MSTSMDFCPQGIVPSAPYCKACKLSGCSMRHAEFEPIAETDNVNHPKHYTSHPSGIECIQITEHMDFCTGSAMKYLWRAGLKQNKREDLEKAKWYIERLLANED